MHKHPQALWEFTQGHNENEAYTTLRHATLGIAVELWHDSMGSFHVYLPSDQHSIASATICCFSSGIVVAEDAVCAPKLLLRLAQAHASDVDAAKNATLVKKPDSNLLIPNDGLHILDSSGAPSWRIILDGASRLLGGQAASNVLVVSHAATHSEIVLFYGGLLFLGGEPSLLPSMDVPDLFRGQSTAGTADMAMLLQSCMIGASKYAPRDPVRLRDRHKPVGIDCKASWRVSEPSEPAIDVYRRQRSSAGAPPLVKGRRLRQRPAAHLDPERPFPPRFCGAYSKWGGDSGLYEVSGFLQGRPRTASAGGGCSATGQQWRPEMQHFLQKTYLGAMHLHSHALDQDSRGGLRLQTAEMRWSEPLPSC